MFDFNRTNWKILKNKLEDLAYDKFSGKDRGHIHKTIDDWFNVITSLHSHMSIYQYILSTSSTNDEYQNTAQETAQISQQISQTR